MSDMTIKVQEYCAEYQAKTLTCRADKLITVHIRADSYSLLHSDLHHRDIIIAMSSADAARLLQLIADVQATMKAAKPVPFPYSS